MSVTREQVAKLYVATFNRAADEAGLNYWVNNSGLTIEGIAQSFFDQPETQLAYPVGTTNSDFVTSIYHNLFNRVPDSEGLAYWVHELDIGNLTKNVMIGAIVNGAQGTDITILQNKTDVSMYFSDTLHLERTDFNLSHVTVDALSVSDAMHAADLLVANAEIDADTTGANTVEYAQVFTLQKVATETVTTSTHTVDGTPSTSTVYWGDPDCADCNIPFAAFQEMLTTVLGTDIFLLNPIGIDGEAQLTNVTLNNGTLAYTTATGEQFTSELALGQSYLALLDSLIYYTDVDGTKVSRFTTKQAASTTETVSTSSFAYAPIVLTNTVNNGGTYEAGFTANSIVVNGQEMGGNDLIVAGELELLHGAYIDGGKGYNTLEVDAKGVYAQPLELLNIQEVDVHNLPNVYSDFYTSGDLNGDGLNIPDYLGGSTAAVDAVLANPGSVLDLSHARELQKLVITEGRNTATDVAVDDLTIVGVRGNAETVLEGMFSASNVNVFYSEGLQNGVNLTLNLGDAHSTKFSIFHNSNTMNINSIGGGNVLNQANFGDATLMHMNISGTAQFVVSDSIASNFTSGHPAIIDAHTNTAGVDITMDGFNDEVEFYGTASSDDHFNASAAQIDPYYVGVDQVDSYYGSAPKSVVIIGGNGNNEFVANGSHIVTITSGNGANEVSANLADSATITVGNGNNTVSADNGTSVKITTGAGDDTISSTGSTNVTIAAGDGANTITTDGSSNVTITTGAGDDTISSLARVSGGDVVSIDAGNGNNTITVSAYEMSITTGTGNDTITVAGRDFDIVANNDVQFDSPQMPGALMNIDMGAGTNKLVIGRDALVNSDFIGVTALEGSTITGENIAMYVENSSNLSQATLQGISSVTLKNAEDLTLTAEQFIAIGADKFLVDHQAFGATATLTLVVDHSMNFSELGIDTHTFNCDGIDLNIVLACNNPTEVVFTLSAEQLSTYIAPNGINVDSNNNYDNNQVVVTNAGLHFNVFGDSALAGTGTAGTIDDTVGTADVTVIRSASGYERPLETALSDTLTIISDITPDVGAITSEYTKTVNVTGAADFTGKFDLAKGFTVDFHALTGTENITITNFQNIAADMVDVVTASSNVKYPIGSTVPAGTVISGVTTEAPAVNAADVAQWGHVVGNGNARVNIEVAADSFTGYDDITKGGFKSTGVSTYVVTDILAADGTANSQGTSDSATIYVCDQTQDLTTLGLQNNRNSTVTFNNVDWGTTILLEGDGVANSYDQLKNLGNPDKSEIGHVVANFFEAGANAVVNINNHGTTLGMNEDAHDGINPTGTRTLDVAGLTLTNASRLTMNVTDGDAVIHAVTATTVKNITVTGDQDVTMDFADANFAPTLATINGSAVVGTFTLNVTGDADLSDVVLSGVEGIVLDGTIDSGFVLTLNAVEAMTLGALVTDVNQSSVLNVNGFSTQALDLSAIDVGKIGTVTTADVNGTIVVDSAVNFGGAEHLIITALTSDTTLQMTAAQFHTYCGTTNENGAVDIGCNASGSNDATLKITDVAANEVINLVTVDQTTAVDNIDTLDVNETDTNAVDVTIAIDGVTATKDMQIINGTVTLDVSGNNDLTLLNTNATNAATIVDVNFTADAILTLTADQIIAIETAYHTANPTATDSAFSIAAGADVTVNVIGLDTQALDLNALQAAGITIGTVSMTDSDIAFVLDPATTFGGAAEIITPTADASHGLHNPTTDAIDGIEPTTVTMSVAQLVSSAGVITGDAQINLIGLVNNVDVDHTIPYASDVANYDLSHIANAGTLTLGQAVVTLADTAHLGGFEIQLGDGQLIRLSTEEQASAKITESAPDATTGVQWLFTNVITAPIDTSKYDSHINTLFIDESLLANNPAEEHLWTTLSGSTTVEKINGSIIPELVKYDRVNTFEAFTNIADGVNYDNADGFQTAANLTMNLEGEVSLGNVLVGDTLNGNGATPAIDGKGYLQSLVINSYKDLTTVDNYNPDLGNIPGVSVEKNTIGNISLNTGSVDDLVAVTINTFVADGIVNANGFADAVNVNGVAAERDGLAVDVGTISFAANSAKTAHLTITGANDVHIVGVVIADAEVSLLDIDASAYTGAADPVTGATGLTIDNIAPAGGVNGFNHIYVMDGHVATALVPEIIGTAGNDLLVVAGGTNDLTLANTAGIDAVHFTANGSLTLTADQVAAIGTADADLMGTAGYGVADAWSALAGHNVTLNITDYNGQNLDLNLVAAAGINIGTITVANDVDLVADTVTFHPEATLGGADSIIIPGIDTTVNLSAAQYEQLNGTGTITGLGHVNVTDLTGAESSIDLSGVTAVNGTITLSNGAQNTGVDPLVVDKLGGTDVALTAAANLNDFSVVLNDIDSPLVAANELAGQTIRFATADQAERTITVIGADDDTHNFDTGTVLVNGTNLTEFSERDTNVVWNFNTITGTAQAGTIDTSGYDAALGRVWVNDKLLAVDANIEHIFSNPNAITATENGVNLNASTIVRVVDTVALSTLAGLNTGVARMVEVEAFTSLPNGLIFDNAHLLVGIDNLSIDLGGQTNIGDISIDDIVATTIGNDNDFGTLTINSLVATGADHYLMPEAWVAGTNPLPTPTNTVGDISSGTTRDVLANVTINAADAVLNTGTITFSDNGGLNPHPTAMLKVTGAITGSRDVDIKSVNTIDLEITALTIDTTGYTGTLTALGASPALQMNATETLTITNGDSVDGRIILGNGTNAGVAGNELSFINAAGFDGRLNLGTVAQIDSTNDDRNHNGNTTDAGDAAFTFTAGNGVDTMTLGAANGLAPSLAAGSDWNFNFTDANTASSLTITNDVVFNAGDVVLAMGDAELIISGQVDLSHLTSLTYTHNTGRVVMDETTSALKMTDEQWLASGFAGATFVDGAGNPPVLHVTAALLSAIGADLTLVRGYSAYNIDTALSVTLREDQADAAYVNGDTTHAGTLTGANVTVYVQETGFGNRDITNLTGVSKLIIETDATDNTDNNLATLPNTFGYVVTMSVQQADSLVGDITKNGNTVTALTGVSGENPDTGLPVDLTTPALNLAEVDSLTLQDDTVISLSQLQDVGVANITGTAHDLTLKAQGDLTAVNFGAAGVVDNLLMTGNTTITAAQEAALFGTVTQDVPASAYTLTINALEALQVTIDNGLGADLIAGTADDITQTGTITADFSNVTAHTLVVNFNTAIPAAYENTEWTITQASQLGNAQLVLSGGKTVNMDLQDANGRTITGTGAVNLVDPLNVLNDVPAANAPVDLSKIAAGVAGTLTTSQNALLDVATNLGAFDVIVGAGTLTMLIAQANGRTITGTGAVIINDAAATAILATDLSAIGGSMTGNVTVANAVAISGTEAQVVAALVTPNTSVIAATSTVTISDTAVAAAGLVAINAATTGLITATAATSMSGSAADVNAVTAALGTTGDKINLGTININPLSVNVGDTNVAITITDAAFDAVTNNVTVAATALRDIGGATTGLVTVTNAIAISGTEAEVVAALVADDTKVTAATSTVIISSLAVTAAALKAINAATSGLITATAATTLVGSVTDVKAVTDAIATTGNAINLGTVVPGVVGNDSDVAITISDVALTAVNATDLSAIGGATTGPVTVTNAVAISGTAEQNVAALVIPDTRVIMLGASTVTITDAAGTAVNAADLSAIGGAAAGVVTVTNAVAVSGSIADSIAAFVTPATEVIATNALVTVNDEFTNAIDYTTINKAAFGTASVTLDDATNTVGLDLTDASVVAGDLANTKFAANDAITIGDAITGGEFALTNIKAANLGGATITLDDNADNAYAMIAANYKEIFETNGVLATANDTITVSALTGQAVNATAAQDVFQLLTTDVGVSIGSFLTASDVIQTGTAGVAGVNYFEADANTGAGNQLADVAAAAAAADVVFAANTVAGTVQYIYLVDTAGGSNGYLVAYDALDGVADQVIQLTGLTTLAGFNDSNIVA